MLPAEQDLEAAHRKSIRHRDEIERSSSCACFYCMAEFPPTEIQEWVDTGDHSALCPRCGIDSVIGSASGVRIDQEFLRAMNRFWF